MTETAGSKLTGHSGNDETRTPLYMYNWLHRRFQFDYDPAASHTNHLTPFYSTIEGTFFLDKEWADPMAMGNDRPEKVSGLNGLDYPWRGQRVFINPPYSRPLLSQFVHKIVSERDEAEIIVVLVKVDTSTAWWRDLAAHSHIEYLRRVAYLDEEGVAKPAATFSSAIAILRQTEPRPEPKQLR